MLFDIVQRGKNAPAENLMKPPPPPEKTEFRLDGATAGSEDPTVLPDSQSTPQPPDFDFDDLMSADTIETPVITQEMLKENTGEFKLDSPEDATQENPAVPKDRTESDTDNNRFKLIDDDAITTDTPTVPASVLIDAPPSQDELVEQVAEQLMPRLEEMVRETMQKVLDENIKSSDPEQDK